MDAVNDFEADELATTIGQSHSPHMQTALGTQYTYTASTLAPEQWNSLGPEQDVFSTNQTIPAALRRALGWYMSSHKAVPTSIGASQAVVGASPQQERPTGWNRPVASRDSKCPSLSCSLKHRTIKERIACMTKHGYRWQCPFCDGWYHPRKDNFRRHIKKKHPTENRNTAPKARDFRPSHANFPYDTQSANMRETRTSQGLPGPSLTPNPVQEMPQLQPASASSRNGQREQYHEMQSHKPGPGQPFSQSVDPHHIYTVLEHYMAPELAPDQCDNATSQAAHAYPAGPSYNPSLQQYQQYMPALAPHPASWSQHGQPTAYPPPTAPQPPVSSFLGALHSVTNLGLPPEHIIVRKTRELKDLVSRYIANGKQPASLDERSAVMEPPPWFNPAPHPTQPPGLVSDGTLRGAEHYSNWSTEGTTAQTGAFEFDATPRVWQAYEES